ncbi:hypothetical protein PanWU01x14_181450 [Parasponia andersonii]|uniref:Uncharacterized protein n=1 Tax=Parasponia andersonii TaxID=3476 RepID=A0A2P5C5T5_PARAD|nr:hypothetical protein PanWU01x14_181450 [Parasponia andersonii]
MGEALSVASPSCRQACLASRGAFAMSSSGSSIRDFLVGNFEAQFNRSLGEALENLPPIYEEQEQAGLRIKVAMAPMRGRRIKLKAIYKERPSWLWLCESFDDSSSHIEVPVTLGRLSSADSHRERTASAPCRCAAREALPPADDNAPQVTALARATQPRKIDVEDVVDAAIFGDSRCHFSAFNRCAWSGTPP